MHYPSFLTHLANRIADLTTHPFILIAGSLLALGWLIVGPVLNGPAPGPVILSLLGSMLLVLLLAIQYRQGRAMRAIQVKLDELIRANYEARKTLLDLEALSEEEIEQIRADYVGLARQARAATHAGKPPTSTVAIEARCLSPLVDIRAVIEDLDRLEALQRLKLLDSPPEEIFDRMANIIRRSLGVPIALISFIDTERQFFKSCPGLPAPLAEQQQVPLSHAICQYTIATGAPFVINDARQNPLVMHHPAVRQLQVIAYCGTPLLTREGQAVGTICAIDNRPRTWQQDELEVLQDLAVLVMDEIALRNVVLRL